MKQMIKPSHMEMQRRLNEFRTKGEVGQYNKFHLALREFVLNQTYEDDDENDDDDETEGETKEEGECGDVDISSFIKKEKKSVKVTKKKPLKMILKKRITILKKRDEMGDVILDEQGKPIYDRLDQESRVWEFIGPSNDIKPISDFIYLLEKPAKINISDIGSVVVKVYPPSSDVKSSRINEIEMSKATVSDRIIYLIDSDEYFEYKPINIDMNEIRQLGMNIPGGKQELISFYDRVERGHFVHIKMANSVSTVIRYNDASAFSMEMPNGKGTVNRTFNKLPMRRYIVVFEFCFTSKRWKEMSNMISQQTISSLDSKVEEQAYDPELNHEKMFEVYEE